MNNDVYPTTGLYNKVFCKGSPDAEYLRGAQVGSKSEA